VCLETDIETEEFVEILRDTISALEQEPTPPPL
jgi:hypothetical protein